MTGADDDDDAVTGADDARVTGADADGGLLPPLGRLGAATLTAVLGLVVGLVGTLAHRGTPPWGLVLAVAATAGGAVLARGLGDGLPLATYAGGVLVMTQLGYTVRPGGDVLVAGDALGYTWLVLPLLVCAVVALLPRRWFARPPRER